MMGARIAMFISSYVPLYVLLVIKYAADGLWGGIAWSLFGDVVAVVLVAGSILFAILLWRTISNAYEEAVSESTGELQSAGFLVESIAGSTSPDLLNYLAVYLMPCLNMSIVRVSDTVVMSIVMVVVGFIYIKERATYLNPLLLLYGYRSYGCIVGEIRIDADGTEGEAGELHRAMLMRKGADPIFAGRAYGGKRFRDFIMLSD